MVERRVKGQPAMKRQHRLDQLDWSNDAAVALLELKGNDPQNSPRSKPPVDQDRFRNNHPPAEILIPKVDSQHPGDSLSSFDGNNKHAISGDESAVSPAVSDSSHPFTGKCQHFEKKNASCTTQTPSTGHQRVFTPLPPAPCLPRLLPGQIVVRGETIMSPPKDKR